MKIYLYLASIILLCISCEDVVDIETPTAPPKLVIEASFNYFSQENFTEGFVKLSTTAPFFDTEIPPVTGASVEITDGINTYIFTDPNNIGIYRTNFVPQFDTDYTLEVIYENETYTATERMIPVVPIDNLEQGENTLFDGDEKELIITYTDPSPEENYYFFDLDDDNLFASSDEFYQGNTFSFSYFYDDLEDGSTLLIQVFGTNRRFFNYIEKLIEQSEGSGSPFSTNPSTLRGNIINTTNSDNFPLGYFRISEGYRDTITLE